MIQVEKIFDLVANSYDKTEKRFEPIHIRTLRKTEKYLHGNEVVLDYGCATGTKTFELAGHVKEIHAIDISSGMIEIAEKRRSERNTKNIDFVQATLFDDRFKRESFDVIMAFAILHLLEELPQTIQRIGELLKPGGLFISTTPCLGEKMCSSMRFQFSLFRLLMGTGLFPNVKRFTFPELENAIVNGKFQIVETELFYHGLSGYFIAAKKK